MPEPVTIVAVGGSVMGLAAHLARRYFEIAKEVADIILGFIALLLVMPVIALCALLIKLSDGGPVLFSQVRVGKDGRLFTMYKLRTMRQQAERGGVAVWAGRDDPRVLPACRWMRRSHVDELPQLVNVIKGDMSLVGPRPERPEILSKLERTYPDVRRRLSVRPGITGLAQVRRGYDTTVEAFREKLVADLEYIQARKWSLDLRIMLATFTKLNDKLAR
jgi:lipopolysaccharide/colanic/teichoic acid biosynthesis glycosyltransferase